MPQRGTETLASVTSMNLLSVLLGSVLFLLLESVETALAEKILQQQQQQQQTTTAAASRAEDPWTFNVTACLAFGVAGPAGHG